MARARFSPLAVLLPFTWAMGAEQRLCIKEFVIQLSCGLSVSQICHQEFIVFLSFILPLVQCETAEGVWCIYQGDTVQDYPAHPFICEMTFMSRSCSEVQTTC